MPLSLLFILYYRLHPGHGGSRQDEDNDYDSSSDSEDWLLKSLPLATEASMSTQWLRDCEGVLLSFRTG